MAKIESTVKEIVANHTTEEIVAYLAREGKTLWRRANDPENGPEKMLVRDAANWGLLVAYLEALDEKLNGAKPTTVL